MSLLECTFFFLWLRFTIFSLLSHSEKKTRVFDKLFYVEKGKKALSFTIYSNCKKKRSVLVQMRPMYIQGTFQKTQYITLLERGTKNRRMGSTTSVHISRSDSAAVGTSLLQNDSDCLAREKWAYHHAHTLDEKGRIGPSECWESGRIKLVVDCTEGILSLRLLLTCTASLCNILQRFGACFIAIEDSACLGYKH